MNRKTGPLREYAIERQHFLNTAPYSTESFELGFRIGSKVRIEGWLEVAQNEEKYPESYFVAQMKGKALKPEFPQNEWAIFSSDITPQDAIERTRPEGSLFDSLTMLLPGVTSDAGIEIVGVLISIVE